PRRRRCRSAGGSRDGRRRRMVTVATISKLAELVVAPALGPACPGHCARVKTTRRHGLDAARQLRHSDRYRAEYIAVIAQLAITVDAPAVHATRNSQRARVRVPRREGGHPVSEPRHGDWCRTV